jgi:hypothetical protein
MSLFGNLKTSDYTELNTTLIILVKMLKNILKDNNAKLDEIKLINDGLGTSDEGITIEDVDTANQYVIMIVLFLNIIRL